MTKSIFALGMMVALAPAPVLATALADGGFEAKGAALPVGSYCYDTQAAGDGFCAASPWVNIANNTGVIRSGNGAWGGTIAAEGNYYGFVQVAGVLAQSFTATENGIGTVSWFDASRNGYSLQSYDVTLVSNASTQFLGNYTSASGAFAARTSLAFSLIGGTSYSLRFAGLGTTDVTTFIDDVAINVATVPEPSSWAMLITGFGLVGGAARRRRVAAAAA